MNGGRSSRDLASRAARALDDDFLRRAVRFTADRLRNAKHGATEALGNWEEWRERARAVRAATIADLDIHLSEFRRRCEAHGGHVHFADDAAEAARIVGDLARARGVKLAAKSKSMVTEEIHLNDHLAKLGIEALETDLGEWIVQLAHETPSHIILPAIHKSRQQIKELFDREGGVDLPTETAALAGFARRRLRERFLQADLGISGCNFAIAETGSIAIFTNEGNGRMVTTLPKTHVVMLGMERIVPSWDDLELMANLLPRSATGQKITTYMNVLTGPRRAGESGGPDELHVVVLDNGRSAQLSDPRFREILNCIRCGACLNVCPVYRQIGGHAYGSVYPGPIGAVLTPLLEHDRAQFGELANASSLCGACAAACPVKIPLHDMLVDLRARNVAEGRASLAERLGFRLYALATRSPAMFGWAGSVFRAARRLGLGERSGPRWMRALLGPLAGWTRHRELPGPAPRSFRQMWDEIEAEEAGHHGT